MISKVIEDEILFTAPRPIITLRSLRLVARLVHLYCRAKCSYSSLELYSWVLADLQSPCGSCSVLGSLSFSSVLFKIHLYDNKENLFS